MTEARGSSPRPAARAPARAARPSPRAASASRLVPQLLGHPLGLLLRRPRCLCRAARFTPENPTAGRAFSLVMIKVEAVGVGGKHPFRNSECFKFRFKTALRARPSRVFRNRGVFPGWQVRSRGCLPRGPRPSRLGNLVTWKVGPLLPVWVEAGGTGCGGWRNRNPRRRETGFLFGGHPCCRHMWLGGRKMPVTFVRLETKTERGCFPAALPANAGDMHT